LITIGAAGLVNALLYNWVLDDAVFKWLVVPPQAFHHGEWWRLYTLLTSGLLTLPATQSGIWHLVLTLLGLYFLSTDLERRWGPWRFIRFLFASVICGTLLVLLFDWATPKDAAFFHPSALFGATAAITAAAVAWGRENPNAEIRLFFFLPMSGSWLLWITIGFCFLELLYKGEIPEGRMAPFGGVITGLVLSGSPSVVRRLYLQAKLWLLRRRGASRVEIEIAPRRKKSRAGPPLRVVIGGLDESIDKRTPPKDKRYLN
jgi:membrane associated rhomboid family serine protease